VQLGLIKVWDEFLEDYVREKLGECTLYELSFRPLKPKWIGWLNEKEDLLKNKKINSYHDQKYR